MTYRNNQKKHIVLIEDEAIISGLLARKLEGAGYTVQTSRDGESGLRLVKETHPDLILLDMMLPRMDGFSVLEKLHREGIVPPTPLIIISNSGQPIEIESALKLGAVDYLIKVNFDPNDVLAKVNHILEGTMPARAGDVIMPSSSDDTRRRSRASVLIIEDDVLLVQLLEHKFMQQKKYEIRKAPNIDQARAVLAQEHIDIILLDVVLPGTDGFTFLNELKIHDIWKHIPVIIMSNLGQQEEINKGMQGGAAGYVIKAHTTPQEIADKVDALLDKKS